MVLILVFWVSGYALIRFFISFSNAYYPCQLPNRIEQLDFSNITICIPVRNEERRLPTFLKDLSNSGFSGPILFCNDHSNDASCQILNEFGQQNKNTSLFSAPPLPKGQLGKPAACAFLSKKIQTPWALFMDVDVRITQEGLADLILTAEEQKTDLLSVFPFQRFRFLGEELVVPLMFHLLLSLLPLRWITKRKYHRFAAANGQILLFRTQFLQNHQLWELVNTSVVEDVAIAQWTKKLGGKLKIYFSDSRISSFMYNGSAEARRGFSKNIVHVLGGKIGSLLHLVSTLILPLVLCWTPFWWTNFIFLLLGWSSFMMNLKGKTAMVLFQIWVYYPFFLIHFYRTLLLGLWNNLLKKNTWKSRVLPG